MLLKVPQHTKILFDGLIKIFYQTCFNKNRDRYRLSIIIYNFLGIFSVKVENLFRPKTGYFRA